MTAKESRNRNSDWAFETIVEVQKRNLKLNFLRHAQKYRLYLLGLKTIYPSRDLVPSDSSSPLQGYTAYNTVMNTKLSINYR
jgi:hypothetical protein